MNRIDRAGRLIALAAILALAALCVGQACRIIEREAELRAEQERRDRCSDLGEWGADCQD